MRCLTHSSSRVTTKLVRVPGAQDPDLSPALRGLPSDPPPANTQRRVCSAKESAAGRTTSPCPRASTVGRLETID